MDETKARARHRGTEWMVGRDASEDVDFADRLQPEGEGETGTEPVFLAVRFVGDEGPNWRPRPVEVAVVTAEGDELSTLVQPDRDLGWSAAELQLSATDLAFAPLLPEVWAPFAELLSGRLPVGLDMQTTLSRMRYEMDRWGVDLPWPAGWDVSVCVDADRQAGLRAGSALEEARGLAQMAAEDDRMATCVAMAAGETDGFPAMGQAGTTILLVREGDLRRFVVTGSGAGDPDQDAIRIAQHMRRLLPRSVLSPTLTQQVRDFEKATGLSVFPWGSEDLVSASPAAVLRKGLHVAFTGSVVTSSGRMVERDEMIRMATSLGLAVEDSRDLHDVDALIAADVASRSNKVARARARGIHIVDAEDFIARFFESEA